MFFRRCCQILKHAEEAWAISSDALFHIVYRRSAMPHNYPKIDASIAHFWQARRSVSAMQTVHLFRHKGKPILQIMYV